MAIALQAAIDAVTDHIEADLKAALSIARTYRDAPQTDTDQAPAKLPTAYLLLSEVLPGSEEGGIRTEGYDLTFDIAVRKARGASGALQPQRTALLESIRAALTNGARFHGYNREWLGETYIGPDEARRETEAQAPWFEVACRFQVTVVVEAL